MCLVKLSQSWYNFKNILSNCPSLECFRPLDHWTITIIYTAGNAYRPRRLNPNFPRSKSQQKI